MLLPINIALYLGGKFDDINVLKYLNRSAIMKKRTDEYLHIQNLMLMKSVLNER